MASVLRWHQFWLALVALTFTLPAHSAVAQNSGALPKYSLPAGRRLTYALAATEKGDAVNQSITGEIQLTVVRDNSDGTSRVVYRQSTSGDAAAAAQPQVVVGWADVYPTGQIEPNATLNSSFNLRSVLPPLPVTRDELQFGWVSHDTLHLLEFTFTPGTAGGQEFIFGGGDSGVLGKVYEARQERMVRFDPQKGMMIASETRRGQNYGEHIASAGQITLNTDETVPADQIDQMWTDYQAYFAARQAYGQKMRGAERADPNQVAAIAEQARSDLTAAAANIKDEQLQSLVQQTLTDHDARAKDAAELAAERAWTIGQPAPEFQTSDYRGDEVRLSDYRGKVVVLNFWSRASEPAMYEIPQLKQVIKDLRRRPVAVLGMNLDADEKDAQAVIDAQQPGYPTLRAQPIAPKYNIHTLPTLIIIDRDGVIRGVDTGYSQTERDDLEAELRPLLQRAASGVR